MLGTVLKTAAVAAVCGLAACEATIRIRNHCGDEVYAHVKVHPHRVITPGAILDPVEVEPVRGVGPGDSYTCPNGERVFRPDRQPGIEYPYDPLDLTPLDGLRRPRGGPCERAEWEIQIDYDHFQGRLAFDADAEAGQTMEDVPSEHCVVLPGPGHTVTLEVDRDGLATFMLRNRVAEFENRLVEGEVGFAAMRENGRIIGHLPYLITNDVVDGEVGSLIITDWEQP